MLRLGSAGDVEDPLAEGGDVFDGPRFALEIQIRCESDTTANGAGMRFFDAQKPVVVLVRQRAEEDAIYD